MSTNIRARLARLAGAAIVTVLMIGILALEVTGHTTIATVVIATTALAGVAAALAVLVWIGGGPGATWNSLTPGSLKRDLARMWARLVGTRTPLTPTDAGIWAQARTLEDLCELTGAWLSGRLDSQPGYHGTVDVDDAPDLRDALIALNRVGFLTNTSQDGFDGTGYDGAHWVQVAAVSGFADVHTVEWLWDVMANSGHRFNVVTVRCKTSPWWRRPVPGIGVTWRDGRTTCAFGRQASRNVIAGELYDGCSDAAIDALCAAYQVTVYDWTPGFNEMWPILLRAAEARWCATCRTGGCETCVECGNGRCPCAPADRPRLLP